MNKLRTATEAKEWLAYQGISAAEFCRMHQLPTSLVYEILNGRKRCLRGMSHNIAVLLGMKAGVVTNRPARVAGAPRNSSAAQAAAGATPALSASERRDLARRDHERREQARRDGERRAGVSA